METNAASGRGDSKSTVLLFDKSDSARAGLEVLLKRRNGLDVIASAGSEQAASQALAGVRPDVILLDLHHSSDGGRELCAAIRKLTDSPIVVLVSFMTPERWDQLRAVGADEFVLKRVDSPALEQDLIRIARQYRRQADSA